MLHCFDPIRTLSFWAILVRLTLAVVCGGVIGAERETKRRPAGFRTHILICLGAAITTLTSQYLLLSLHLFTDVARLGAQVISGIGFIGAGTIIVTRDKRVKGLTTAAGLWAAAIIGLACGAGYVECAAFATLVVLVVELVLIRLFKLTSKNTDLTLYIEYAHAVCMESVLALLRERRVQIESLEISRIADTDAPDAPHHYCALIPIHSRAPLRPGDLVRGHVVLGETDAGNFVVHRIIRVETSHIVLLGDGNVAGTETIPRERIYGIVDCGRLHLLLARIWLWMRPVRKYPLWFLRRICRK